MAFACKKAWDLHKHEYTVKGTYVQACDKFFSQPNKTTQEKVVASQADCECGEPRIYCGQWYQIRRKNLRDQTLLASAKRRQDNSLNPYPCALVWRSNFTTLHSEGLDQRGMLSGMS